MVPNQMRYQTALRSEWPAKAYHKGDLRVWRCEVKTPNGALTANICERRKRSTGIVPESGRALFTVRPLPLVRLAGEVGRP